AAVGEQAIDERFVADVPLDQAVVGPRQEGRHVAALARRIVEVVEAVERGPPAPAGEQPARRVRADEAGAAGHQDVGGHGDQTDGGPAGGGGGDGGGAFGGAAGGWVSGGVGGGGEVVGLAGAAEAGAAPSPCRTVSWYRFLIPACWRLRMSQRSIQESLTPTT